MNPENRIDGKTNVIIGMGMRHEPFDLDVVLGRCEEGARHLPDDNDVKEMLTAMRVNEGFTDALTGRGWFELGCYEYGALCAGTPGLGGAGGDVRMLTRYLYLRYLGVDGDEIARRLLAASGGGDPDGDPDGGDDDGPILALVRWMRDNDDLTLAVWSGLQEDRLSYEEITDDILDEASRLKDSMDPGRRSVMEAEDYLNRIHAGLEADEDPSPVHDPVPVDAGPELG